MSLIMSQKCVRDAKDMSWMEWVSVLKLSSMWQMNRIHGLALQKIEARISNRKTDEWITVLKISTHLRIKGLRDLAIKMLWTLGPLEQIELAIECCIEPWLLQGYTQLTRRDEAISVQEEERLGWDRVANLFRVRHRQLHAETKRGIKLDSDIQTTFASEFANIAVFDHSPISYLRPELHTAVDPGIIQRDKTYYHVYIILSVNFFTIISTQCRGSPNLFQVENTLFKIPRSMLEDCSEIFRDMFLLPPQEDVSCDGSSDEQPLFLHGVCKAAFRRLLMAVEQWQEDDERKKYDSETARTLFQEWASVLELSCMWQMANVRQRAVEEILKLLYQVGRKDWIYLLTLSNKLGISKIRNRFIQCLSENLKPVEKIQLGIELRVYSLLHTGYVALVVRTAGISTEDEELLGKKATSKLFRLRDKYLKRRAPFDPDNRGLKQGVMSEVKELFTEELKETVQK